MANWRWRWESTGRMSAGISGGSTPGLYISCGEQDGLYASNERFSAHLASLGIEHRFEHWPGAHSWDFWDASLRAALAYFFD